jgi:hypothetical protein
MRLLLSNLMLSVTLWLPLIELLQLLHAAKGNPVNDRLIHPHHECRRDDKFVVFVIDLVHYRSYRMGAGAKQLQLLAVMGDEVIDTDPQIPRWE